MTDEPLGVLSTAALSPAQVVSLSVQWTPAAEYLPAGHPVQSVALKVWPAGQSWQEVEAGTGWYLEAGQEVQAPAEAYLPAGQPVQPEAPPQPSPVPHAGQSRQEAEAETGWYLEAGQEVQTAGQGAPSDEQACVCVGGSWHVLAWYVFPPASLEMSMVVPN